jgi:outer membrane lipoprotein carrier protein
MKPDSNGGGCMQRLCTVLVLMVLGAASASVFAQARERLDRFAADLTGLQGHFEQQVYNGDGSLREQSEGDVAMYAPRQFHVWLYDVDLEQVTVRRQADEEAQSPLVVLTDPASLDQRYSVSEAGRRDGLDWLRLEARDDNDGFREAMLGLGSGGLERMRLEDSLGGRSEIRFSDWQRNPDFPPDHFKFTPPEGVDLVGDLTSVPDVRPVQD